MESASLIVLGSGVTGVSEDARIIILSNSCEIYFTRFFWQQAGKKKRKIKKVAFVQG